MPLATAKNRQMLGFILVALQFSGILLLILLASPAAVRGDIPPLSALLVVAAVALFLWILMHNRLGNFNIQPSPKREGMLITSGPYRWVRHPMYSAVLLGGAALAHMGSPLPGWTLWLALALVLWRKAALEEQWMQEQHPGYQAYMQRSKRFIPWVL